MFSAYNSDYLMDVWWVKRAQLGREGNATLKHKTTTVSY